MELKRNFWSFQRRPRQRRKVKIRFHLKIILVGYEWLTGGAGMAGFERERVAEGRRAHRQ